MLTHSRSQEREAKRARLKDEAAAAYIGAEGARDAGAPANSGNVVSSDSQAGPESCCAPVVAGRVSVKGTCGTCCTAQQASFSRFPKVVFGAGCAAASQPGRPRGDVCTATPQQGSCALQAHLQRSAGRCAHSRAVARLCELRAASA